MDCEHPKVVISHDSSIEPGFFDEFSTAIREARLRVELKPRGWGPPALEWVMTTAVNVLILKPFWDAFVPRAANGFAAGVFPKLEESLTALAKKVLISTRARWQRLSASDPLPQKARSSFFAIEGEIQDWRRVRFLFDEGTDEPTYEKSVFAAVDLLRTHCLQSGPDPFAGPRFESLRSRIFMTYDKNSQRWVGMGELDQASGTLWSIDAILPYLELFEAPGFTFGHWITEPGHFPWFVFSEQAGSFHFDLYGYGWVQPFDWAAWLGDAYRYINDPALVESADVETIRKLLTLHVRSERFGEGHLSMMYDRGHLTALLRRLKAIRNGDGQADGTTAQPKGN
jgi:hypothetical protein